jgi:ERCC4-type nuclease
MQVWVDTRERNVFVDELRRHIEGIESKQLECGDIAIVKDGEVVFLVERKTVADLEQSICDGRYHEQKLRMLQAWERERLVYLIEGLSVRKPAVATAIFNIAFFDGIKVVETDSVVESCVFLADVVARLTPLSSPVRLPRPHHDDTYVRSLNAKKQKNLTPELCYRLQLSQLPQVSISVAKGIAEIFPDMRALVKGLEEIGSMKDRVKALSKIPRVGGKLATTVCTYMGFGI